MSMVTVIIPTYNRARYVCQALDSVLNQTYRDFDVIVVDDGSTDETSQLLESYKDRVTCIRQDNQGRAAAKNAGLSHAQGKYVAFLDSDDIWCPDKLERQVNFLETRPELSLAHGEVEVIDSKGNPLRKETERMKRLYRRQRSKGETYSNFLETICMFPSTVLVRRECFGTVGDFDTSLDILEDFDWFLRVASRYKVECLNQVPVTKYRVHQDNAYEKGNDIVSEHYVRIYARQMDNLHLTTDAKERTKAERNLYHSLSIFHFNLGNLKESRSYALKAIAVSPFDPHTIKSLKRILASFRPVSHVAGR